jgi:hypothetical protein
MKILATVLLVTLFASIPFSKIEAITETTPRSAFDCLMYTNESYAIPTKEACAWEFAKYRFSVRFPEYKKFVDEIEQPARILYRDKYIIVRGQECYGATSRDMTIEVYLTGDVAEDLDTLIHEMCHVISMTLGQKDLISVNTFVVMHSWIENFRHWEPSIVASK